MFGGINTLDNHNILWYNYRKRKWLLSRTRNVANIHEQTVDNKENMCYNICANKNPVRTLMQRDEIMVTSIIMTVLITLLGGALVFAAFNMKRLVAWENHVLTSLADSVQEYREALEEEQRLLKQGNEIKLHGHAVQRVKPQQRKKDRAA